MLLEIVSTLVIVFHGGNVDNVDVSDVGDTSTISQSDKWFPLPADYTGKAQDYTFDDSGLKLKTPAPTPAQPDPQLLKDAIFASVNIPVSAKVELYKYFPLLDSLAFDSDKRIAGWAQLVETYGQTWLTTDVQDEVKTLAATANMALE